MAKKLLAEVKEGDITYSLYSQPGRLGLEAVISLGNQMPIDRMNSILTHLGKSKEGFAVRVDYRDISGGNEKNDMQISITYDSDSDPREYDNYSDQFWGGSSIIVDYLLRAEKTSRSILPGVMEFSRRLQSIEDGRLEHLQYPEAANIEYGQYVDAFLSHACHSLDEAHHFEARRLDQASMSDGKARKSRRIIEEIEAKWQKRRNQLRREN
jgi:hypothetical protein